MKNKKQPGHMGTNKTTIENLVVMDVDADSRVLAIKGSVPGHKNGFLFLRPSYKLKSKEVEKMKAAWSEKAAKASQPAAEESASSEG